MGNATYQRTGPLEIIHLKNKALRYKEHTHVSVYTIGLVLRGEALLFCDGAHRRYPAGSFFVVAPYQVHALLLPCQCEIASICADKNLVSSSTPPRLAGSMLSMAARLPAEIDAALIKAAACDVCGCAAPKPVADAVLPGVLSLCGSPETEISIQALAGQAKYSLHHYIKLFKKHVGISPHQFQLQNRVRKAQKMLENGKAPADIAAALGFYDQSHFTKCFKSVVGFTPGEYRQAAKPAG